MVIKAKMQTFSLKLTFFKVLAKYFATNIFQQRAGNENQNGKFLTNQQREEKTGKRSPIESLTDARKSIH